METIKNHTEVTKQRSESFRFEHKSALTQPPEQQVTDKLINGLQKLIVELGARQIDFGPDHVEFLLKDYSFKITVKANRIL